MIRFVSSRSETVYYEAAAEGSAPPVGESATFTYLAPVNDPALSIDGDTFTYDVDGDQISGVVADVGELEARLEVTVPVVRFDSDAISADRHASLDAAFSESLEAGLSADQQAVAERFASEYEAAVKAAGSGKADAAQSFLASNPAAAWGEFEVSL